MMDFVLIPENPAPENFEIKFFKASDGANLRVAYFPVKGACGTIILATGWAEFIEKYFETVNRLHARKLNVAMMDWRGQGLSDREQLPRTQWKEYFSIIASDLQNFIDNKVVKRFAEPYFLMTHSMGGLPALIMLADGYARLQRALLCAPMTRLAPAPQHHLMRGGAWVACAAGLSNMPMPRKKDDSLDFEGNMYTSDQERHERFQHLQRAAPHAVNEAPTFGWIKAALAASDEIHSPHYFDSLKIPVRIVSAELERRIDSSDHAVIADKSPLIDRVTIPGALHEIMMERDEIQARYWREVDRFFGFSEALH